MDDLTRNEGKDEKELSGYAANDALRENEQSQTSEEIEKAPRDEGKDDSASSTMDDITGKLLCPRCGKAFDAREKHCPYCGLKNDLKVCEVCGATIAKNAKQCPKCGTENSKPLYKNIWFWIVIAVVALVVLFTVSSNIRKSKVEAAAEESSAQEIGTSEKSFTTLDTDEMAIVGKWKAIPLTYEESNKTIDLTQIDDSFELDFDTDYTGTLITTTGGTVAFEWNYVLTTGNGDKIYSADGMTVSVVGDKTSSYVGKLLLMHDGKIMLLEPSGTEKLPQKTSGTVKTQSKDSTMTSGQRNALKSAESYLRSSAFSYTGLIEQLEYEGFSNEDATYAADHCGADWKEQAVKSAESYLKYSSFSKSGLIDQLEFEGFTHEQAVYGADQAY